jgi:hypothetical protein
MDALIDALYACPKLASMDVEVYVFLKHLNAMNDFMSRLTRFPVLATLQVLEHRTPLDDGSIIPLCEAGAKLHQILLGFRYTPRFQAEIVQLAQRLNSDRSFLPNLKRLHFLPQFLYTEGNTLLSMELQRACEKRNITVKILEKIRSPLPLSIDNP